MMIPPNTPCFIRAGASWRAYTTRQAVEAADVAEQPITSGPAQGHHRATITARGRVFEVAIPASLAAPTVKIDASDGESRYLMHVDADGIGRRCSCPGFAHRGKCRHLKTASTRAIVAAWRACVEAGLTVEEVRFTFEEGRKAPHLGAALNEISDRAFEQIDRRRAEAGQAGINGTRSK
jgi:hypothetical protein